MAKIRMGFVSNSSSSSFVVAKSVVGEDSFKKIVKLLKQAVDNDNEDSCYYTNENYALGDISHHNVFWENLDTLDLPQDSYLVGD